MKYTYTENKELNIIVRVDQDGIISFVPIEPANSDYQVYLETIKPKVIAE